MRFDINDCAPLMLCETSYGRNKYKISYKKTKRKIANANFRSFIFLSRRTIELSQCHSLFCVFIIKTNDLIMRCVRNVSMLASEISKIKSQLIRLALTTSSSAKFIYQITTVSFNLHLWSHCKSFAQRMNEIGRDNCDCNCNFPISIQLQHISNLSTRIISLIQGRSMVSQSGTPTCMHTENV